MTDPGIFHHTSAASTAQSTSRSSSGDGEELDDGSDMGDKGRAEIKDDS